MIPLYFPVSHAEALTGGFNGPAKLDQSDQGYNDRAEQVMVMSAIGA